MLVANASTNYSPSHVQGQARAAGAEWEVVSGEWERAIASRLYDYSTTNGLLDKRFGCQTVASLLLLGELLTLRGSGTENRWC